jgi:hypothetical protein
VQEVGGDQALADALSGTVFERNDRTKDRDRGHIVERSRGPVAQIEEVGIRKKIAA